MSESHATETFRSAETVGSARRLWTRHEFERAGELGVFGPEERLELIAGEVIRKVTPQKTPHATTIRLIEEWLRGLAIADIDVRVQLPVALDDHSEPEPDITVATGGPRDYEREHPSTALLLVEVADTTLAFDRTVKAGLYAKAGVQEYWIVNLRDRVLEIHRSPAPMAEQPFGHHFLSVTRHTETESVSTLLAPAVTVRVRDLLPRAATA
jgi:Uma2 family endonuclease